MTLTAFDEVLDEEGERNSTESSMYRLYPTDIFAGLIFLKESLYWTREDTVGGFNSS